MPKGVCSLQATIRVFERTYQMIDSEKLMEGFVFDSQP